MTASIPQSVEKHLGLVVCVAKKFPRRRDLSFDDLVLGAGDYHLARPGVRHPVARTRQGCMLLLTAAA